MEFNKIKELMSTMRRTGVTEVSIEQPDEKGSFKLTLKRENKETVKIVESSRNYLNEQLAREASLLTHTNLPLTKELSRAIHTAHDEAISSDQTNKNDGNTHNESKPVNAKYIKSPMVGTFYTSPSPEEPTFIQKGDTVNEDTVVCIIEAMKVMNEVKAGISGTVTEILVENGHPVEFGTKLFEVE